MRTKLIFILLFLTVSGNLKACNKNQQHFNNTFIDSVRKSIIHKTIQDSLVQFINIVKDESEPFATPDIDFVLNKNDTISILLLSSKKEFKKVLLNKYLIMGHYRIYYKSGTFKLFQEYLNDEKEYFILIISSDEYNYKKGILIK